MMYILMIIVFGWIKWKRLALNIFKHGQFVETYIFSGTNLYSKGKYGSDGKYDSNLVDKQPGVYLLIKTLSE